MPTSVENLGLLRWENQSQEAGDGSITSTTYHHFAFTVSHNLQRWSFSHTTSCQTPYRAKAKVSQKPRSNPAKLVIPGMCICACCPWVHQSRNPKSLTLRRACSASSSQQHAKVRAGPTMPMSFFSTFLFTPLAFPQLLNPMLPASTFFPLHARLAKQNAQHAVVTPGSYWESKPPIFAWYLRWPGHPVWLLLQKTWLVT